MTKTLNTQSLGALLAAHLNLSERYPHDPASNPLASATVDDVRHGAGILKGADMLPALDMSAKFGPLAIDLERFEARESAKVDKSAKRMARARRMAEKKAEFDAIIVSDVRPDSERLTMAWRVVFPLIPTVTRIAKGKQRWAARYLGSVVDDVAQVVLERMAVVIAKQDRYDLRFLIERADELGEQEGGRERKPRVTTSDEERKAVKREARARGWLMSMVNNRVMGTLADLYTESRNLRWDNLDIIITVMASINGVGGDALLNQHKADRAPAFLGTKFQRPDGIDPAVLATAINAAITERGLDLLVEILLNEENREFGGAFKWTKNAERVFLATEGGEWLWDMVCKATEHHSRPKRARADAARMHVRNLFEWLPPFIGQVVDALDPHFIGWSSKGRRAVMASDFELFYLGDPAEAREPLAASLRYTSVEDALAAITEAVQVLTGADLINSIANA